MTLLGGWAFLLEFFIHYRLRHWIGWEILSSVWMNAHWISHLIMYYVPVTEKLTPIHLICAAWLSVDTVSIVPTINVLRFWIVWKIAPLIIWRLNSIGCERCCSCSKLISTTHGIGHFWTCLKNLVSLQWVWCIINHYFSESESTPRNEYSNSTYT